MGINTYNVFIPPYKILHATVTAMMIKIVKPYLNYYYSSDWGTNVTTQGFAGALL
jgi:hypothetical protein